MRARRSDHLFLKLTNVASFALFFGSSVYGAIEGSNGNKETYFTPADWSLHLWTVINLLFLGYIVFQFFDESHSSIHASVQLSSFLKGRTAS